MVRKKILKSILWSSFVFIAIFLIVLAYLIIAISIENPTIKDHSIEKIERFNPSPNFYTLGNNWLRKSDSGLWEMYIEGDGFERGVAIGKLTKELAEKQELAFVKQIKKQVPSDNYLYFLKYFVAYFNRELPEYITEEYQQEIYGVSLYASDKFDFIGPKYYRILNYHAAHDIGHALQDKNMTVGCTSFAAWNDRSEDGKMIVARNFDFYSGDEFAENKIICFCKPTTGYKFTYITWAGFTGVVSGMNDQGLTVTINSSKSDIPSHAATPISLLVKEILQYSKNINEAMVIAKKRTTFVSESILIASKNDGKSFIIEKTPTKTNLYSENRNVLICANHFQSQLFKNDITNNKNIVESSSMYRKFRMEELVRQNPKMNYLYAAKILRDQNGINDKHLGYTNEKGINQLIAHHSVILKPENGLLWVSTQPFQLGKFVCYDFNKVFKNAYTVTSENELIENDKTIQADPFLHSQQYVDYKLFLRLKEYIQESTKSEFEFPIDKKVLDKFILTNPESYYTYWIVGNYHKKQGDINNATANYKMALTKEVATKKEADQIKELLDACTKK